MAKWGEINCPRCAELEAENRLLKDAVYIDDLTVTGMADDKAALKARIEKLEAKLSQMQRTLDWTEDKAKDYKDGREMMGHMWANAEEGRRKAIEAMERAVFLWEQPHYGDNDTIIDHGSEAIDTLRATLAELKGEDQR